ncbi:MAG TPA: class I SAM-dependent methyltransferase [Acidobacteriota bacterium]|nr:class I SAM-dependent methyltransferase [Acidobacteriota bacterium]
MKKWRSIVLRVIDAFLPPFLYISAWLFKHLRRVGVAKLPHCKNTLLRVGVFPIRRHYYEPQFDYRELKMPLCRERTLPGIDWNVAEQIRMLDAFSFAHELAELPQKKAGALDYDLQNVFFGSGDAEYWYQLIRLMKPQRIFEVGSGNSTLIAMKAIRKNREENPGYVCKHLCIEPYERPWLEDSGAPVIRRKVEDLGVEFFSELQEKDVLFIDSSHVIRPQGDVLFEYLELLPILKQGVIVHFHDIFSPRDYPESFLVNDVRFWNEQYLLEATLSQNDNWKVIGALNYLHHNYHEKLKSVAPFVAPEREPSSFYIQKIPRDSAGA